MIQSMRVMRSQTSIRVCQTVGEVGCGDGPMATTCSTPQEVASSGAVLGTDTLLEPSYKTKRKARRVLTGLTGEQRRKAQDAADEKSTLRVGDHGPSLVTAASNFPGCYSMDTRMPTGPQQRWTRGI